MKLHLPKVGSQARFAALLLLALAHPAAAQVVIPDVSASLDVKEASAREGEDVVFTLSLSRLLDFKVRYAYHTQDLNARAGADYEAAEGYVVFEAGSRVAQVRIRTHIDSISDGTENFNLVLSDPETHGYGMVWFQYIWTDRWIVSGLPAKATVQGWIRNTHTGPTKR